MYRVQLTFAVSRSSSTIFTFQNLNFIEMSTANGFYLKLRTKDSNLEIRNSINAHSSFIDLLNSVSNAAGIQVSNLKILSGFPRKALVFPASESLEKCGIKSGDTLFVAEEENFNSATPAAPSVTSVPSASLSPSIPVPTAQVEPKSHITDIQQRNGVCGILMKKVVPSDNSCLFTSFEFVVSGIISVTPATFNFTFSNSELLFR